MSCELQGDTALAITITGSRHFTIGQLCAEFGVTARALRFYEARGLLNPDRRGQQRLYSGRDRARVQLILRGKRVGFSLAEIGDLLDLYDKDDQHAVQMAASVAQFRRRIAALEAQKVDIELSIDDLQAACAAMEARLGEVRPDLLPSADDDQTRPTHRVDIGAAPTDHP